MNLKTIFNTVTCKVKDIMHRIQGNKISIDELATFIKNDNNTIKTSRHLLGIDFHQYKLEENNLTFLLETKGDSYEKILSLSVLREGRPLLNYKSYKDKSSQNTSIALPELAIH